MHNISLELIPVFGNCLTLSCTYFDRLILSSTESPLQSLCIADIAERDDSNEKQLNHDYVD